LSHTRSEITLSDSDLEIYSIFFPAPWQVTLVVRPGRNGAMRAGFFVREADGTVKSERSYLEFNFPDRLAGVLDRTPPTRSERGERRRNAMPRDEAYQSSDAAIAAATVAVRQDAREISVPSFGQPHYLPSPPPKKKWPWLVGWAIIVILAAVFGLRYWMFRPADEPIGLGVIEKNGQLEISWSHAAHPVSSAVRGALVINDGSDTRTFALSPAQLTAGKYAYERKTGDVEVRMSVEDGDGAKKEEGSHFIGQPPVKIDANEVSDLKQKRDELEAEVKRLTRENEAQAEKIQQLQRTIQIMTARGAGK
jgi:hypothetical protein